MPPNGRGKKAQAEPEQQVEAAQSSEEPLVRNEGEAPVASGRDKRVVQVKEDVEKEAEEAVAPANEKTARGKEVAEPAVEREEDPSASAPITKTGRARAFKMVAIAEEQPAEESSSDKVVVAPKGKGERGKKEATVPPQEQTQEAERSSGERPYEESEGEGPVTAVKKVGRGKKDAPKDVPQPAAEPFDDEVPAEPAQAAKLNKTYEELADELGVRFNLPTKAVEYMKNPFCPTDPLMVVSFTQTFHNLADPAACKSSLLDCLARAGANILSENVYQFNSWSEVYQTRTQLLRMAFWAFYAPDEETAARTHTSIDALFTTIFINIYADRPRRLETVDYPFFML